MMDEQREWAWRNYAAGCASLVRSKGDPTFFFTPSYEYATGFDEDASNFQELATYLNALEQRVRELEAIAAPEKMTVGLLIDWKTSHMAYEVSRLEYLWQKEDMKQRVREAEAERAKAESLHERAWAERNYWAECAEQAEARAQELGRSVEQLNRWNDYWRKKATEGL